MLHCSNNFRKLHQNALSCRLGCDSVETQFHTFTLCIYIGIPPNIEYLHTFENVAIQKEVIQMFVDIDKKKKAEAA